MAIVQQILIGHFVAFVLVFARVSGLFLTAPLFSSVALPLQFRGLLAVATTLVLVPTYWGHPVAVPVTPVNGLFLIAGELLVGAALGLGVAIMLAGIQVAGQIIGQLSGMSLADVFDPAFEATNPVFSQLLFYIAMTVFLVLGGDRLMVEGLLETFAAMPPGSAHIDVGVLQAMVDLLGASFAVGVRAAAPVMTALLVATVVLGIISRTMPQLNVLALGFSMNSLAVMALLMVSLGGAAWLFGEQVDLAIVTMQNAITTAGATTDG